MAADQEGKEGGSEDLFEDLDKFFASIGEGDWPDPLAPEPAPQEPGPLPSEDDEAPAAPARPEPEPQGGSPEQAAPAEASDELPPEAAELEGFEAGEPEGAATGPAAVEGGPEPRPRGAGEMSSADWTRL